MEVEEMKRVLLIAASLVAFALAADAQGFTYLAPPTVAVADFEVSMSAAEKEASKQFYGQLVSQSLLTVLVQQNAASSVYAPRDGRVVTGAPVYDPGMTTVTARLAAADASRSAAQAIDRAAESYVRASDDSARSRAMDDAVSAASAAAARSLALEEIARIGDHQVARLYFPSIFKIYDKKYVESALQNGTFTVKDLYTKSIGAFNFTDLNFLVLGNVYETRFAASDAIGINVRVLNTRRAEEVYSYTAIVGRDMHDLPIACAQICQRIMTDLLNSSCAQFTITESAEVSGAAGTDTGISSSQGAPAGPAYDYRLFWQPRQVKQNDATVADSDDSDKREVRKNVFYWVLPGQYVVSVYNRKTQQVRPISFSIGSGDIRNVVIEKQHLDTPKGTITIGGIGPTTSYVIVATPKKQREQYWWEIFDPAMGLDPFTVTFADGEIAKDKQDNAAAKADGGKTEKVIAEYRPATQDLLISNVPLAAYDVVVTRNPPEGLSGITGVWYTSTRLSLTSKPLSVTVRDPKDVKLSIADFGLQEKQAIESPRTTKVTFILQPGFGYWGWIHVNDHSLAVDKLYWGDKEKVTIGSEYAQADWDAYPEVTYTIWTRGTSKDGAFTWWQGIDETFKKSQIPPEKDLVVFVDLAALRATAEQNANRKAETYSKTAAETPVVSTQADAGAVAVIPAARPAAKGHIEPPSFFLNVAVGGGYGSYESSYWDSFSSTTVYSTSGTGAVTVGTQFYWYMLPDLGLGVGALVDAIIGGGVGGAGTFALMIGDPEQSDMTLFADIGAGSGFTAGLGFAFLNETRNGGLTVGFDYFGGFSSSSDFSISVNVGYMFGF
jgi:hypothetical protein